MDEKLLVGENKDPEFDVGAAIQMRNNRMGIIRYRGRVHDAAGVWFGVELIAPSSGKSRNNGVRSSRRYFFAPNGRAVFIQKKHIKKLLDKNTKSQIATVVDQSKRIEALSPQEWTTNDVCRWLSKIEALEAVTIFLVHEVTGEQLLKLLPEDLEYKLGIKDKNLITKIIKAKERLEAQFTILPNVREGAPLTLDLDEFKEYANDFVQAPVFRIGEQGRSKSLTLLGTASKKRDSYSIPERWRGKLPSPKDSLRTHKAQFPPLRGTLRLPDQGLQVRSTPQLVHLGNLVEEEEPLTIDLASDEEKEPLTFNLGADLDDTFGFELEGHHRRSSSLMKIIESIPMKEWKVEIVVKWINSIGGKASSYGKLFRDKEIPGSVAVVQTLDSLKALGVEELGVRKRIILSRNELLTQQKSILHANEK